MGFFALYAFAQINYRFNQTKSAVVWRQTDNIMFIANHEIHTVFTLVQPAARTIVANFNRDIYPSVVRIRIENQTHLIYC